MKLKSQEKGGHKRGIEILQLKKIPYFSQKFCNVTVFYKQRQTVTVLLEMSMLIQVFNLFRSPFIDVLKCTDIALSTSANRF